MVVRCKICGKKRPYSSGPLKDKNNYMCRKHQLIYKHNGKISRNRDFSAHRKIWELYRLKQELDKNG